MGNSASFITPSSVTTLAAGPSTKQNVFNDLDEIGLLLGQARILGERNSAYKQRLARVFSERANSTYRGLINGITRGLGLSLYEPIIITPKPSGTGFLASNPSIVISGAFVYLYSDIDNATVDLKIDRYDRVGEAPFLGDLVTRINQSTYFTATLVDEAYRYNRSMTLVDQKSEINVTSELVPAVRKFALANQNVIVGTLFFSNRVHFLTEVASEGAVTSAGKYFIDYDLGIVTSFSIPLTNTSVRYIYLNVPMNCVASPVIINNVQSLDFRVKLFEQVLADDGTYVDGLPTAVGSDLINELLTVFPVYWGE